MKRILWMLICATISAHAEPQSKIVPVQAFTVIVPRAELPLTAATISTAANELMMLEFFASSWRPQDFRRPAYQRSSSAFSSSALPFSGVGVGLPVFNYSNGAAIYSKFGFSAVQLERGESGLRYDQILTLLSVRAGIEYQGLRLFGFVHPMLGFSLLPSYALSSASEVEGEVNEFGLPMEAAAGFLFRPSFLYKFFGFRNGAFGLSAHYLFGRVGDSRMNGAGLLGRVQVSL